MSRWRDAELQVSEIYLHLTKWRSTVKFQNKLIVLSCLVLSCLVLSCLVLSCLVLSCLVLSCLVLSCLVLSCLVLSCLVLSCLVLSCLVLSCLVLSCLVLVQTTGKYYAIIGWMHRVVCVTIISNWIRHDKLPFQTWSNRWLMCLQCRIIHIEMTEILLPNNNYYHSVRQASIDTGPTVWSNIFVILSFTRTLSRHALSSWEHASSLNRSSSSRQPRINSSFVKTPSELRSILLKISLVRSTGASPTTESGSVIRYIAWKVETRTYIKRMGFISYL